MNSDHRTIPSGIPPLDARVGGALCGRLHLLSGGPGTGKTTACLQFIRDGLRGGEAVAMLTTDRVSDLASHAAHLAIDLATPLRDTRMVLLRYRPGFSALVQHSAPPEQMLDDLRRLFQSARPTRVVIDTTAPLLAAASHSDATMNAVVSLFEEMDATTFVTYAGNVSAGRGVGYDYRLEPFVERAAGIFHLDRLADALTHDVHTTQSPRFAFHVLRVRQPVLSNAPAVYTIDEGTGMTLVAHPRIGAIGEPLRAGIDRLESAVRLRAASPSPRGSAT